MIKATETIYRFVKDINLLSPKSDKHQFSSNNINTQSREKVVRINEIIIEGPDNAVILYQILPTYFNMKMYRDQFGEFVCRHWGLKG